MVINSYLTNVFWVAVILLKGLLNKLMYNLNISFQKKRKEKNMNVEMIELISRS